MDALLIRRAELLDGRIVDVRIAGGRVVEIGDLPSGAPGRVVEARGGLLLPGLHDHYLHVAATAAALTSVPCGPPQVMDGDALAARLAEPGEGWLRGVGYHESVAGMIDRAWLDRAQPARPVRVQHRSGRMWVFNTAGLELLLSCGLEAPAELDRQSGRLFDADSWLRQALGGVPPAFDVVGATLARYGVTGLTEMSPANDDAMARHFAAEHRRGALPQRLLMAGKAELGLEQPEVTIGPLKIHLHEAHLPDFEAVVAQMRAAHEVGRVVAVHCVTEVELVFTLQALRDAGPLHGDRIEHASVTPDALLEDIAQLGLTVVAQPNFVSERGDAYRMAIPQAEWPSLYRLRSFRDRGVTLAGGSDAPFGDPDPWAAMAAAVTRRTRAGEVLGEAEALAPEAALDLFLADPVELGRRREVEVGATANLCLLSRPWRIAREALAIDLVRATLIGGRVVHEGVDEAPG